MTKSVIMTPVAAVLLLIGSGRPASAAAVTFNFNSLSSGASSSSIASYMDGVLGCGSCVTVTGAVADRTYNGEGRVVGPGGASLTLGNSNGATNNTAAIGSTDTFIANTNDSSTQISNEISIQLTGGYTFAGNVSFDYEIFPDGTTGQPPDFQLTAGTGPIGSGSLVTSFGTGGIQDGVTPGTTDGSSNKSPFSGSSVETNAQYIGTWSGVLASGTTDLNFIDWPATIGFDNLCINGSGSQCGGTTTQSSVPEPGTMLLLATGLAGFVRRKKSPRS